MHLASWREKPHGPLRLTVRSCVCSDEQHPQQKHWSSGPQNSDRLVLLESSQEELLLGHHSHPRPPRRRLETGACDVAEHEPTPSTRILGRVSRETGLLSNNMDNRWKSHRQLCQGERFEFFRRRPCTFAGGNFPKQAVRSSFLQQAQGNQDPSASITGRVQKPQAVTLSPGSGHCSSLSRMCCETLSRLTTGGAKGGGVRVIAHAK
jgi:hypothetical protein